MVGLLTMYLQGQVTGSMAISHTFETMEDLRSLIAKIGDKKIQALRESGDSAYVSKELIKHLL